MAKEQKLKESISAGGIVRRKNMPLVALVQYPDDSITYAKGHIEGKEKHLDRAYIEIFQELGIDKKQLEYIADLGSYKRMGGASGKPEKTELKTIQLYYFETEVEELKPTDPTSIIKRAFWEDLFKAEKSLTFSEDRMFYIQFLDVLTKLERK